MTHIYYIHIYTLYSHIYICYGVLFLSPSDAYDRSFLYLLYTLIKVCYTKALSDQASSLAPDWILLLWGPRIPASWFNNLSSWGSSGILQDKVRMLGALVLCSLSEHIFCCAVLILWFACVNEWNALCEASEEPCSEVPWWSHTAYGRNLSGVSTNLPRPGGTQCLLWEPTRNGQSVSPFSVKLFGLFDHFITPWELEVLT